MYLLRAMQPDCRSHVFKAAMLAMTGLHYDPAVLACASGVSKLVVSILSEILYVDMAFSCMLCVGMCVCGFVTYDA